MIKTTYHLSPSRRDLIAASVRAWLYQRDPLAVLSMAVAVPIVLIAIVRGLVLALPAAPLAAAPLPLQPIILIATPTPAPFVQTIAAPPAPIEAPAVAPAPIEVAPVPQPIEVAPMAELPPPAPEPEPEPAMIYGTKAELPTERMDALNDPTQNGGNLAPSGCPFPIVNGMCGNGQPAPKERSFGSKESR